MRNLISRATVSLAVAVGLGACGGSSSSSSSPAASGTTSQAQSATATSTSTAIGSTTTQTPSGPPPCRAAGLALSYLGGQGATGHGELGFALKNTLSTSCNTIGYPGVEFLSTSGAPLPTNPTHTTDDFFGHSPLHELVLGPGQEASFRLGVTHGDSSGAGCTTADGVQVIAPNDTATMRVSIPGGASECGTATVSPMEPGTTAFH